MSEDPPLGLVERVHLIASMVDAVCGHTDDPQIAGMRVATFCLALNFHLATEADPVERAHNFVSQVRDISGCDGVELTAAIALFSIRAQDILAEEIKRIQDERKAAVEELEEVLDQLETLEAKLKATDADYTKDVYEAAIEAARLHGVLGHLTEANKTLSRRDRRRRNELQQVAQALKNRNKTIEELRAALQEKTAAAGEEPRLDNPTLDG